MLNVIVGTEGGLFRVGDSTAAELADRNIGDVAVGADRWWAIADGSTVIRRATDGDWETAVSVNDRRLHCLRPAAFALLLGTDEAHLLALRDGASESMPGFEEAPGRSDWFTPWGGPPAVRSIAARGDSLYVNVHVGGILRSDDDGATWTPTIDINSDVHEVVVSDDAILAATAFGLAMSRDGGRTWEFDESGLHASYARAVALSGDWILMTASLGPFGGDAGIYRRALGRSGFEKIHSGLPEWFPQNLDTGCVAARDGVVALGTEDGRVFLSEDNGGSWDQIGDGLPGVNKVVLE